MVADAATIPLGCGHGSSRTRAGCAVFPSAIRRAVAIQPRVERIEVVDSDVLQRDPITRINEMWTSFRNFVTRVAAVIRAIAFLCN